MAYLYSNALNVSIALIVFGLIQVAMFVSCLFGCYAAFPMDFASPAWSGGFAIFTGFFGLWMIGTYREIKVGKVFFFFSVVSLVTSLACLIITAGYSLMTEYGLADQRARRGRPPGERGPFVATGLAIDVSIIVFAVVLVICACYATCLHCCCDRRPSKGYVMTLETVHVENAHPKQTEPEPE